MAGTGSAGLTYEKIGTPAGNAYFMKQFLKTTGPRVLMSQFFDRKTLPRKQGDTAVFMRVREIAPATTPFSQGNYPEPVEVHFEELSVNVNYYGSWAKITRKALDMSPIDLMKHVTKRMSDQWVETMEVINWMTANSGTKVRYANGSSRDAVNEVISLNDIREVTRDLENAEAPVFRRRGTRGSDQIGTRGPTMRGYAACTHPDVIMDLEDMNTAIGSSNLQSSAYWRPIEEYGGGMDDVINEYERGTVHRLVFFAHNRLVPAKSGGGSPTANKVRSTNSTNADVYLIPVFGKDALCCIGLAGYRGGNKKGTKGKSWTNSETTLPTGEMMTTPVRKATKEDPLGQWGTAGWLDTYAAFISNDRWLHRIEVASKVLA